MEEERRKYLKEYLIGAFNKYPKETLLNAFLKAKESEDNFNLLYSEVESELTPKAPIIAEPIPQQQETKKTNNLTAVRLTPILIQQIKDSGINRSELIREALKLYFENNKEEAE